MFSGIAGKICNMKPDIVINTVAYNDVDACENEGADQKRADMLNVTLVDELSEICIRQGIKLIHFSTNYVFPGEMLNTRNHPLHLRSITMGIRRIKEKR